MTIEVGFDRKSDPKRYDRVWRRLYNKQTANVKRKLADYRYADKKDGYEDLCDYTYDELLYVLSTNTCTYCESSRDLVLDRIDHTRGHTKENTVVACDTCNTMRADRYTVEEMRAVVIILYEIQLIYRVLHKKQAEIKEIIDQMHR